MSCSVHAVLQLCTGKKIRKRQKKHHLKQPTLELRERAFSLVKELHATHIK